MTLLADMKILLRIKNTAYDTEISDLISACQSELIIDGVNESALDDFVADPTDMFLKRIFSVYVKANFGWDNPDSDKLMEVFEKFRNRITMSNKYMFFKVTINITEQQVVIFDAHAKETNDSGTVVFYTRAKNHIKYIVAGTEYYVDVTGDTVIEVV
jgi:hypothetical protein